MPIKYIVTLFGCKYKCGKKHQKDLRWIEEHEEICWYNPKNKTCKSCKYETYSFDSDDYRSLRIRECKVDNISYKEYVNGN